MKTIKPCWYGDCKYVVEIDENKQYFSVKTMRDDEIISGDYEQIWTGDSSDTNVLIEVHGNKKHLVTGHQISTFKGTNQITDFHSFWVDKEASPQTFWVDSKGHYFFSTGKLYEVYPNDEFEEEMGSKTLAEQWEFLSDRVSINRRQKLPKYKIVKVHHIMGKPVVRRKSSSKKPKRRTNSKSKSRSRSKKPKRRSSKSKSRRSGSKSKSRKNSRSKKTKRRNSKSKSRKSSRSRSRSQSKKPKRRNSRSRSQSKKPKRRNSKPKSRKNSRSRSKKPKRRNGPKKPKRKSNSKKPKRKSSRSRK